MSYVQSVKSAFSGAASATTIAVQINNVAAGAVLGVFVQCGEQTATATCADDVNAGNYSTASPVTVTDATDNNRGFLFYKENVLGGSPTVTCTFNQTVPFRQIVVFELSGRVLSGSLVGSNGAFQAVPGTGTDAVSTGNLSTTALADIIGATWVENGLTPTITKGTGYTERLTDTVPMEAESADAVASGNNPVTWTISSAASMLSMGMAFKAAVTGPVGGFINPVPLW